MKLEGASGASGMRRTLGEKRQTFIWWYFMFVFEILGIFILVIGAGLSIFECIIGILAQNLNISIFFNSMVLRLLAGSLLIFISKAIDFFKENQSKKLK